MTLKFGPYDFTDLILSASIFTIAMLFALAHFGGVMVDGVASKKVEFSFSFVTFTFLIVALFFVASKRFKVISDTLIERFADIPPQHNFNFPEFTSYIGNLMLGSSLSALMIFSARNIVAEYGAILAGLYVSILTIAALTIMVIALFRFAMLFSDNKLILLTVSISGILLIQGLFYFGIVSV